MNDAKLLEGLFKVALKSGHYDDARGYLDELAQSETWRKRNPSYLDRYAAIPFTDRDGSASQARPAMSAAATSNVVTFHSTNGTVTQHGPSTDKAPKPDTATDTGRAPGRPNRPPVAEADWWPSRI